MIQNVAKHMTGIELYGIVSICLFFAVFSLSMIWACLQKKSLLKSMSALPLEDEPKKGKISHE